MMLLPAQPGGSALRPVWQHGLGTRPRLAVLTGRRSRRSRQACRASASDPGDARQQQRASSWSTTPAAGVQSWRSSSQDGSDYAPPFEPRRQKLPTHNPSKDGGPDWQLLGEAAADIARYKGMQQSSSSKLSSGGRTSGGTDGSSSSSSSLQRQAKRAIRRWQRRLRDLPGWLLYRYYNWRTDGVSDLLLVTIVSSSLLFTAAVIKLLLIDPGAPNQQLAADATAAGVAAGAAAAAGAADGGPVAIDGSASLLPALWGNLYNVVLLAFGENFPSADTSSPAEELFSILVALFGLAGFALALALVEQVVLETNMANVKRGSKVYEAGHFLVLGWAVSQRDLEVLIKLVQQLCCAAAAEGGVTVVVLTMREKLEMEELFRLAIPPAQRAGSRLVFRQGSPLLPADLSLVAASAARCTIIVSDQSRSRDEADAQSVRCAILLDELDDYRGLRRGRALGHIVVETRTSNAVPLLRYSCSKRVIALPTQQLNARRLGRMIKRPFISWVSQRLWAFNSRCSLYIEAPPPRLIGTRFRNLPYLYPDAIILGVAHVSSGRVTLNPLLDYTLEPDDQLVFCRPTAMRASEHQPLPELLTIPELERLGQAQLGRREVERPAAPGDTLDELLRQAWLQPLLHAVLGAPAQQPAAAAAQLAPAAAAAPAARQQVGRPGSAAVLDDNFLPQHAAALCSQLDEVSGSSRDGTLAVAALRSNGSPGSSTVVDSPGASLSDDARELRQLTGGAQPSPLAQRPPEAAAAARMPATAPAVAASAAAPAATSERPAARRAAGGTGGSSTGGSISKNGGTSNGNSSSSNGNSSSNDSSSSNGSNWWPAYAPLDSAVLSSSEEVPGFSSHEGSGLDRVDCSMVPEMLGSDEEAAGADGGPSSSSPSPYLDGVAGWSMLEGTLDSLDMVEGSMASLDHPPRSSGSRSSSVEQAAADFPPTVPSGASGGDGGAQAAAGAGDSTSVAAAAAGGMPAAAEAAASLAAAAAGSSNNALQPPGSNALDPLPPQTFNYVPQEYLGYSSSPQAVLVAGWAEGGFMADLLWEMDQGGSCLPPGSEVTFVNSHPAEDTLGVVLRGRSLQNLKVSHVLADPLQRSQLAALPLGRFRAALVLADERWVDPDLDESNGIDAIDQPSVLRQDALMVMVQLNIRKLLEDLALPPINIICQKVATQGLTRFEDRRRLPLGISVNLNSMAAKLLTQVAVNPLSMLVITGIGGCSDLTIVDASEYVRRGEAISFWGVLSRAQAAGDVLLGYYVLPSLIDQPIESTINPQGLATRSKLRVWNTGSNRLKFIIIRDKECPADL